MRAATNSTTALFSWIGFIALVVSLVGCGSGRPKTVPVSGEVTFNGGSWPGPGKLYFLPDEPAEGYVRRAGSALFGEDGTFVAKTWIDGDGLTPGTYKVRVTCWKHPPVTSGPAAVSYIDTKYHSAAKSELTLEVAPDAESLTASWNITGPGG